MPASFASLNYWGVHGFGFVNAQGQTTWGKWLFEPAGRKKVELGTLKVTAVAAQGQGACQGVTFTPTVLPKGVLAGNDPVLAARAAPYGISLGRRTAEAGLNKFFV